MTGDSDNYSGDEPIEHNDASEVFNSGIIKKTEYFDLFISYKRDNGGDHGQKLAEELYEKLTQDGFKVWLDNEEIGFSNDFELRLEQAILHSKRVACVIGPAWVNSPNCRFEVQKAVEFEKRIIPIHYQQFRGLLREKKDSGELSDYEWRRLDKPQEVDFSSRAKFRSSYKDLKALCELDDHIYTEHTKLLCEGFYWAKHNSPKSMLLTGVDLKKAKLFKRKSDADSNYSSFAAIQNEFLDASKTLEKEEVSVKRQVYLAFSNYEIKYARELNIELKLHDVTTWFDDVESDAEIDQKAFLEEIINSDTVVDVLSEEDEGELDVKVAFARSNSKRVVQVTASREIFKKHLEEGEKNIFFWDEATSIDELISSINGDEAYIRQHSKLFSTTYDWEQGGKNNKKLIPYSEAVDIRQWYKEAEANGSEPPPNARMIDFVERSISYAQGVRRKKRLTFWTTTIGIVFLAVFATLFFFANNRLDEQTALADAARESAKQDSIKAYNSQVAANKAKVAAQKDSLAAVKAQDKADLAQRKAFQDSVRAYKASLAAIDAAQRARRDSARAALANANAILASKRASRDSSRAAQALVTLGEIQKESDSISFVTKAKIEAIRALEFLQLSQRDSAQLSAELAVSYLTDSINASANVQTLYRVYNDLLPSNSILSIVSRQSDKNWIELKADLKSFYPDMDEPKVGLDSAQLFSSNYVNIPESNSSMDRTQLTDWVKQVITDTSDLNIISALTLSPSAKWLAIGYKNGVVEIWDWDTKKSLERLVNHSYRITSMAFSPRETQIAVSSIDERFSFVELNSHGRRDPKSEIIKEDNGIRALEIFYWNDEVLITKGWRGISKAWATDVLRLRKELKESDL